MSWYAAKVYYNKVQPLADELQNAGKECFVPPADIIKSLLFVDCDEKYIRAYQRAHYQHLRLYSDLLTGTPSVIPDKEMELFRFVTTSGEEGLLYLGDDKPEYHCGDLVRVTDGPFKGAIGHIKRIKKDRRLIITISGIAAVATTYIHPDFLETVEEQEK